MAKNQIFNINRRETLKKSFLFSAVAMVGGLTSNFPSQSSAQKNLNTPVSSDILIVYFTRSGNTRVVAKKLQQSLNANMFELIPAIPYPIDYRQNVAEATREKENNIYREINGSIDNFAQFQTIYLGFPIWGGSPPSIIKSFLSTYDLSQKTLIPFITHGNYGIGNSLSVLQQLAPNTNILTAYTEQCDQERDTIENVESWLNRINL